MIEILENELLDLQAKQKILSTNLSVNSAVIALINLSITRLKELDKTKPNAINLEELKTEILNKILGEQK